MKRTWLVGVTMLAAAAVSSGQSINLRFGPAGGAVPDSSYGAVGPAGHWNLVSDAAPMQLRGLDGTLTGVGNFVPAEFTTYSIPPVGPVGDDALLLGSSYVGNYPEDVLTIRGLDNGQYNVIFYGLNPALGFVAFFGQDGGDAYLSGSWPGFLGPGVHSTLPFNVTDGTLTFLVLFGLEGGSWSGMQIVQVPGPGVVGVAGAAFVMAARRRRGA